MRHEMLVLTFQVAGEPLALDIRHVREVVPRVHLQPVSGAPGWLAGVFVYRGRVIPVIDLHRLAGGSPCPPHLSSRIILVPNASDQLLGLLATKVADIREIDPLGSGTPTFVPDDQPDLGQVIAADRKVLRLVDPDRLLPADARRFLSLSAEAGA